MQRRLAAILDADVVGYSRLMADDEAGTLAALKEHRRALIDPAVARHNGRIVKLMGDGALVEFASVVDAVTCAAGTIVFRCSDIFGNTGGDWVACIQGQLGTEGNFSRDPLFCKPEEPDLRLRPDSPCLPGDHPDGVDCGLLGAVEGACPVSPAKPSTWGRIKATNRSR